MNHGRSSRAFLIGLLCSATLHVQAQKYRQWQHFNSNNGLPQNSVVRLEMDTACYLWVGTEGGLVRYDGGSLRTIELRAEDAPTSIRIRYMLPTQRGELIVLNGHNITFQIMDHGEPRLVQREAKRAVLWGDIASVEHFVALPEPDGKNWADHGELASHTYPSGERVELGSDVFRRWQGTKLVSSITTGHPLEKFFFLNGEPIGLAGSDRALLFDPSTGTSTELRLSGIVNNGEHEWPQIFWIIMIQMVIR